MHTRRTALALGAGGLAGLALAPAWPRRLGAQEMPGDSYELESGTLVIHPVQHASFVMGTPDLVVYVDPVGGAGLYAGLPPPGLILITHEHGDHFDLETLNAIAGDAALIANPAVHAMLPEALKSRATAMANGEETTAGALAIAAVPAYNITPDRLQYHPQGRDNGYIVTVGGRRVYVAGDTEDIPEMRALSDIDIAFVPMNLPYTMTVEQAAAAVTEFTPAVVYPYHYQQSDIDLFERLVADGGGGSEVVRGAWYPS